MSETHAAAMPSRSSRPAALVALGFAVFVVAALSYRREFPGTVEAPYWYLSYVSGFVRRGLLGTFVSPFILGRPLHEGIVFVATLCTAMAAAFLLTQTCLAVRLFARLEERRQRLAWCGVVALALISPGLPMLGRDLGFLDLPIAFLALIAGALTMRGSWIALVPAVLGPLTHEAYFFLALPLLLPAVAVAPTRRLAMAVGAVTVAATLAVWLGSTADFTWQTGIPIAPSDLFAFAHWQLGQGVVLSDWPVLPLHIWLAAVLPVLGIVTIAAVTLPRLALARVVLGTLFSVSILVIAIDTERLLAWACLTAPVLWGMEMSAHRRGGTMP